MAASIDGCITSKTGSIEAIKGNIAARHRRVASNRDWSAPMTRLHPAIAESHHPEAASPPCTCGLRVAEKKQTALALTQVSNPEMTAAPP
eukprot:1173986-Rhodomonas_salina.8